MDMVRDNRRGEDACWDV